MEKAGVRQELLDLKTLEHALRHSHVPHFYDLGEGAELCVHCVYTLRLSSPLCPAKHTWEREAITPPFPPSQETQAYILHGILETVLLREAG